MSVLMLRGPQTVGELRTRTERMADFAAFSDVEAELERLSSGPDPLARRMPRRPGQKEERWAQLLAGELSEQSLASEVPDAATTPTHEARAIPAGSDVVTLRADVDALRDEVARISAIVEELRVAFDL